MIKALVVRAAIRIDCLRLRKRDTEANYCGYKALLMQIVE